MLLVLIDYFLFYQKWSPDTALAAMEPDTLQPVVPSVLELFLRIGIPHPSSIDKMLDEITSVRVPFDILLQTKGG